ncbi:hypothetical protein TNCV_4102221 [Trichonephila clavipes]|nr:hypothetical protein TNCV_4102221 [Trichonephila clavipes]
MINAAPVVPVIRNDEHHEKHDGDWLEQVDSGGVRMVRNFGVHESLETAVGLVNGKVNINSNWLHGKLKIGEVGGDCPVRLLVPRNSHLRSEPILGRTLFHERNNPNSFHVGTSNSFKTGMLISKTL